MPRGRREWDCRHVMKETAPRPAVETKLEASQLHVWFGERHALRGVALSVIAKKTVAVIGASGSGKSTLLRAFNRLHVLVPNARLQGSVKIDGAEILGAGVDTGALRRRVGMVFTVPAMLPGSILDNVAFGLRAKGVRDRAAIEEKVESAVRRVLLWEAVGPCLDETPRNLSAEQRQLLCLARALVLDPDVLLLDDPTARPRSRRYARIRRSDCAAAPRLHRAPRHQRSGSGGAAFRLDLLSRQR
jgi:phosphate transport system ATP-binding protein